MGQVSSFLFKILFGLWLCLQRPPLTRFHNSECGVGLTRVLAMLVTWSDTTLVRTEISQLLDAAELWDQNNLLSQRTTKKTTWTKGTIKGNTKAPFLEFYNSANQGCNLHNLHNCKVTVDSLFSQITVTTWSLSMCVGISTDTCV